MKPKADADPDELRRLVREEAAAYQSIYGWSPVSDVDPVWSGLQLGLNWPACLRATRAIRELVEDASWDDERQCATDHPELVPCWRVSVIAGNPTFPPLVRCQAGRSILPDELPGQTEAWRRWAEEAARGTHDDYLRELHWYTGADWTRHHWSVLHAAAVGSLTATGAWASKPDLIAVREEILRLPEPPVPSIRLSPGEGKTRATEVLDTGYPVCLAAARTLVDVTRRWDRNVSGNRKLRYYENYYDLTLDAFRARAADPWLREFLTWADRCADLGFGLRLDY
jgi:hypothetical protein